MSQFTSNNTSNNNTTGGFSDTRPEHHIHGSADPLPGTRGVNPAAYDSMESSTAGAGAPTSTNFGGVTGDRHHESSHLPGGLSSHGDKTHTDRHTETGAGRFESADNHTGVLGSHNDNARTDRQTGTGAFNSSTDRQTDTGAFNSSTDRQTDTGAFNSSTQRQPESGHHTGALGSHAATRTDRQTETGAGQTHSGAGYDAQRQTQSGHHTGDLGRNTGDDRHTGTGTGPLDQHKGGVAAGGRSDVPQGHASAVDKLIGKSEQAFGKVSHNPEIQERGQLRETGGKAAVTENARASRD